MSAGPEVAALVEFTEAAAFADMLAAAPASWNAWSDRRPGGWIIQAPAVDILLFNRVIGTGLPSASRAEVDDVVAPFRATRLRNWGVQVSPDAEPEELGEWLGEHGLVRRDSWSKVYRPAGDVPAVRTDLRIERAGGKEAATLGRVTRTAFGMPEEREGWLASLVGRPNWFHYLAWSGDEPVAAAALYVSGAVGWLGVAGTLPAARRRGAQSALMARRLLDGARAGCQWFVTETGQDLPDRPNPSYQNMMRMGFQLAYHRPNYLPAG